MGIWLMLDPTYWLFVGPAMLLALLAQLWVKAAFAKWSRVGTASGVTGAQAAYEILRRNGLEDVDIELSEGMLSDHYSPTARKIGLSRKVYAEPSVSAVGVAAHEVGHALQHANASILMGVRSLLVPVAGFSNMAILVIILGMFIGSLGLMKIGIVVFAGAVLFQIVTLPVELDASRRAAIQLAETGLFTEREIDGARAVLRAAAMTYVAAAAVSIAYLLYFALRAGLLTSRD